MYPECRVLGKRSVIGIERFHFLGLLKISIRGVKVGVQKTALRVSTTCALCRWKLTRPPVALYANQDLGLSQAGDTRGIARQGSQGADRARQQHYVAIMHGRTKIRVLQQETHDIGTNTEFVSVQLEQSHTRTGTDLGSILSWVLRWYSTKSYVLTLACNESR